MSDSWSKLQREVVACSACPRLARWRVEAGANAPRAHRGASYWSRPVPSFGDQRARLLILGLAPGAHGANRTGRPFTGDGAGPFLYGALHRAGFASAAVSTSREDGLELLDARITNAVRCVPPANQPTPAEVERCFPFLRREIELARDVRVVLCLGGLAWKAALRFLRESEFAVPRPAPKFGHGSECRVAGAPLLLGAFHPSQLNTRTRRLTAPMFDAVLKRARRELDALRSA